MATGNALYTCKNCGHENDGNYCADCGQSFSTQRIMLKHLSGEIFHFFTHMEHGFGYTLKQLVIAPGIMQKDYLEGHRVKLQKPFSMFFLCATFCGLAEYWINVFVSTHYNSGDPHELYFYQHYLVFEQVFLAPFYALVGWIFFMRYKYNYAEWLVITFYITSFFFLLIIPVNAIKLILPDFNTRFIELPIITAYNIITIINLFKQYKRWIIIILCCCSVLINYALAIIAQHIIINNLIH